VKILTVSLASVFLLTGCSALGGEESDSAACEELSLVVSATEVNLDNLTPAAVAETLRAQVQRWLGKAWLPVLASWRLRSRELKLMQQQPVLQHLQLVFSAC
jgi:hypothetical protein